MNKKDAASNPVNAASLVSTTSNPRENPSFHVRGPENVVAERYLHETRHRLTQGHRIGRLVERNDRRRHHVDVLYLLVLRDALLRIHLLLAGLEEFVHLLVFPSRMQGLDIRGIGEIGDDL